MIVMLDKTLRAVMGGAPGSHTLIRALWFCCSSMGGPQRSRCVCLVAYRVPTPLLCPLSIHSEWMIRASSWTGQ